MFYPGGNIWIKRITHLFVLCTIGINLFINDVQNVLLKVGQDMLIHAGTLSDPAVSAAYVLEKSIVPALAYIEDSRFKWIIGDYGIPDSKSLQERIDSVYELKQILEKYAPIYTNLSLVLKIINWFFWIPITLAGLWILADIIIESKSRAFDIVIMIVAIGFNIASYRYLSDFFIL